MMASPLWMPGAARHPVGDTAPCDPAYPPKAIAHITWSGVPVRFSSMLSYFTVNPEGRPKAPHILWEPITGQFAQFYPADSRSKSVADRAGGTRTNRAGRVVIQIEALFSPGKRASDGKVYDRLVDTPCTGWPALLTWITGLGVPARWPMGPPTGRSDRDEKVWATQGGWYGHSQVPENTHTDPVTWPAFTTATTSTQEDDMTPAQEAKLDYVSKQCKSIAELVIKLDQRREAQIRSLGAAVNANVDTETTELDAAIEGIRNEIRQGGDAAPGT